MKSFIISYDEKSTRNNILEVLELFPTFQFTLIQNISTADLFIQKSDKRSKIKERIEKLCLQSSIQE